MEKALRSVLYDKNKKAVGVIADSTRCYVTQERNGLYECEIDIPVQSAIFRSIEKGCCFTAKPDDISEIQKFRVYKISKPLYGIATVYGEHCRYELSGIPVGRGTYTGVPSAVIAEMLTSVKPSTDFTVWSDISSVNTVTLDAPDTVGKMLAGTSGSVLDVFGGEFEFDDHVIKLHKSRGREKATEIRYAKNLTGFTCESDIDSTYTHVYPFYRDEAEDVFVELPDKLIALGNAAALPFEKCYMLDLTSGFEDVPTTEQLAAKANSFIRTHHLDEISYRYKVSFIPLWQTTEYKNVAALERCALCDTVTVFHDKTNEKISAKIVRTVYDSIAERYVSMELGNAVSSFADTVTQSLNAVRDSVKSTRSFMLTSISRATSRIVGNKGGYVVLYDSDGDGEPDELLIMDTPSIFTAAKVWRWNASGLGYSRSGYGGPYALAITMQGEIVADFVSTGVLNASLIRSGELLADLIKAGVISDKNGNVSINMDDGKISMSLESGYSMRIWTNGITMYDAQGNVLTSMFVSANHEGVLTANQILVGQRDSERTAIGVDAQGVGYVTTDKLIADKALIGGCTLNYDSTSAVLKADRPCDISVRITDNNGSVIGSFYESAGGSVLRTGGLYVDGHSYASRMITVDGTVYHVLAQA